jgi:hypothetical protein
MLETEGELQTAANNTFLYILFFTSLARRVLVKLNPELPCQKQRSKRYSFYLQIGLKFKEETRKCYVWSIALYGAENWTFRKVDQKDLESFEMWCWRRMEVSRTDRVRNEEVLHRVKEERNILHTIKRRKANCIGHIMPKNCLLKHLIEGKIEGRIEMTGRRGRRLK